MKNPFSLSTSWNSSRHNNGHELIKEIKSIGFDTVELGFSLTKNIVDDILSLKEMSEIKVSSLHNMCPLPEDIAPEKASPDFYSLASLSEEDRASAVKIARNTISYAKRLDAEVVILHMGRVEINDKTRKLASLAGDMKKYSVLKNEMIFERNAKKTGYLDSAIKSLGELVPYALEKDVALAVETRYYYREIPLIEEFEEIFKNFKPGSLFYWHDTGHAEVAERLGFARHKTFLNKFRDRLIGVHLHDIIGIIDDHKAPGCGTFNFNILKPYIRNDTLKVIEAHQPATAGEILEGIRLLEKIFGS